ncbi:MAG TPA: hypothetical protein VKH63_02450 [Candidatus Acidoferrum sp.]|nr:hypothetical protein [Candidatus Acidoferrum sp.]
MKALAKIGGLGAAALAMAGVFSTPVRAQVSEVVKPVIVDTAVPIIVNTIKPKPKYVGLGKFEGYVMHANTVQITVRAKGNDMSLQSFALSERASAEMQTVVDRGGYQYGDKVTVYYDQTSLKALKVKGKPSRPL